MNLLYITFYSHAWQIPDKTYLQVLTCMTYSCTFCESILLNYMLNTSVKSQVHTSDTLRSFFYWTLNKQLIGGDPTLPRIWAYIPGRYWSAKRDVISLWPPGLQFAFVCWYQVYSKVVYDNLKFIFSQYVDAMKWRNLPIRSLFLPVRSFPSCCSIYNRIIWQCINWAEIFFVTVRLLSQRAGDEIETQDKPNGPEGIAVCLIVWESVCLLQF
jgi:hypothetical protein